MSAYYSPQKPSIGARLFAWVLLAAVIALALWPLSLLRAQEAVPVPSAPAPAVQPEIVLVFAILGAVRIAMKAVSTYRNGYVVSTPSTGADGVPTLAVRSGVYAWAVWLFDAVLSYKPAGVSVAADPQTIAVLHPEQLATSKSARGGSALALALFVGLAFLGSGCLGYKHARYSDGGQMIEETRLRAPFLTKTTIEGLKTSTKQTHGTNGVGSYTRTVGVSSADNQTDSAGIQALEGLLGRAILSGLNAASPVPLPKP